MSLRPDHPKKLTLADLQPGDVVLSAGSNMLDTLIKLIDHGDYSHCTQYIDFDGTNYMVVEATEGGVVYHPIDEDMKVQDLVDVYRFVSPAGNVLGEADWPAKPVLDSAKTYVGGAYAYDELIMGGLVLLAADIPKNDKESAILRLLLGYIESKIVVWLNTIKKAGKTPMTCVQVATSAYWNALSTPPNKYALEAIIDGNRTIPGKVDLASLPSDASTELKLIHKIRNETIDAIVEHAPEMLLKAPGENTYTIGGDLALGTCTPTDLQRSPTLKFIGCLKDTRASS